MQIKKFSRSDTKIKNAFRRLILRARWESLPRLSSARRRTRARHPRPTVSARARPARPDLLVQIADSAVRVPTQAKRWRWDLVTDNFLAAARKFPRPRLTSEHWCVSASLRSGVPAFESHRAIGTKIPQETLWYFVAARPMGLEPTVYPVTGDRFSQLNYGRIVTLLIQTKTDDLAPYDYT